MRYYRDLQPGETLQEGDERFRGGNDWAAVGAELFGLTPNDVPWGLFRRPVDLPVLQPVTPEAIAELEGREAIGVLFVRNGQVQIASYNSYRWWWWRDAGCAVDRHHPAGPEQKQLTRWWSDAGCAVDRPTRGYFVELKTLEEGEQ